MATPLKVTYFIWSCGHDATGNTVEGGDIYYDHMCAECYHHHLSVILVGEDNI